MTFADLLKLAKRLPPETPEQRLLHAMDFAYGNLALTRNHKPSRDAFKSVAMGRGMTEEQFEVWAEKKQWSR